MPAWATEPILLVDHDPAWAQRARAFVAEVEALFAGRLISEVLHVGSTAVPGLRAKPIVDLQAGADDPDAAARDLEGTAASAGWLLVPPELDRRAWRRLFVRVDAHGRSRLAHLHLMPPGDDRWRAQLLFRDRLRADAGLRVEYVRIKDAAAVAHADDREAYTRAKDAFVRRVVGG